MDACVEDGTATTPWNCLYTIMPPIPNSNIWEDTTIISSYQKHVAQGDLPTADAQTATSTIDTPACSLTKTFFNGR